MNLALQLYTVLLLLPDLRYGFLNSDVLYRPENVALLQRIGALNLSLSENFLFVGKFMSKYTTIWAKNPEFGGNLGATLKFWASIMSSGALSVSCSCLSKNCNCLPLLLFWPTTSLLLSDILWPVAPFIGRTRCTCLNLPHAAADVDAIDETGRAVDEPDSDWSLFDHLLDPWMIAVYVFVALIACVSSVLLLRRAVR